ncbi:hypothetical protein Tdes44962_MAKER09643 [Teratosphaeria destructans]|uniref:Uncharacterized protein n=1 Tax=Teratosphaeria destructans TaxID=418781 RepID=A0A9W7W2I5_9PEZI|nr:hypothetical protein Tdes44962_MAKER09643 [Teratosphaeria destructans]
MQVNESPDEEFPIVGIAAVTFAGIEVSEMTLSDGVSPKPHVLLLTMVVVVVGWIQVPVTVLELLVKQVVEGPVTVPEVILKVEHKLTMSVTVVVAVLAQVLVIVPSSPWSSSGETVMPAGQLPPVRVVVDIVVVGEPLQVVTRLHVCELVVL